MELETEIPIWFHGRVKWISNLTTRSTCFDVIQAILSSSSSSLSLDYHSSKINEDYQLYECWRGIERPLKSRCRLLKLWRSWSGECQNVILTLRSRQEQTIPTYIRIRQQENKLNKLKRQVKKVDKQIEKLNCLNKLNENDNNIITYLNVSHSIIRLNNEIDNKKKDILRLSFDIENENNEDFVENDFKNLLYDVNQTLISSRKLTQLSDELDQKITTTIEDIDQKQILLDELELDYALQDNIDIDSLDDQHEQNEQLFSIKQIFSSPNPIIPIKALTVQSRPTAIVEPSLSTFKSKESLPKSKTSPLLLNNLHIEEKSFKKTNINMMSSSSIRYNDLFQSLNNNDRCDQTVISIHSNDQQLVTLV
ncbi:unnamed protein product [Rotaria socialis]|uniref:Uncharacterized protein n=1 Tax=Rotaria socialis TaxID=392032 RepID=A0A820SGC0_9BILA|nr:unnamed protein product [Rotaria socialis]CAF3450069.1 unnamed protein product [Rotaria socialis]CAF3555928.1 unnamed protein product [Rotaria socialis]CAF4335395.1 unnamed protein product [Rotaria socialis]CAF4452990.1 unnamed protein product [Rotaria socialis]